MPTFTIEQQYLVPVFRHLTVEAIDLNHALEKADSDGDWSRSHLDGENAREITVTGAWDGPHAYNGQNLLQVRDESHMTKPQVSKPLLALLTGMALGAGTMAVLAVAAVLIARELKGG